MNNKKEIHYPAEITFKSIFRNKPHIYESIKVILSENSVKGDIKSKESSNGKFISYTIEGIFPSEEILNGVCNKISSIEGYMSMF